MISGQDGQFTVTDASRGGLFLDGRDKPLGAGVAARLENGTRLRMGDLVMRAELVAVRPAAPTQAAAQTDRYFQAENSQRAPASARSAPLPEGFDADDFFTPRPAAPQPPRPESLPQPFEGGPAPFAAPRAATAGGTAVVRRSIHPGPGCNSGPAGHIRSIPVEFRFWLWGSGGAGGDGAGHLKNAGTRCAFCAGAG